MLIVIDHSDASPIYRQIVRQVSDQIGSGQIPAGEKLPTTSTATPSCRPTANYATTVPSICAVVVAQSSWTPAPAQTW